MGFKTTSTRFTQAKSAQSSDLVAFNNAASGGPSISGTSLSTASAITTVTATPGQSAASGTTSSGVLISTVVYTDSGYNTLTANAASTTFGYVRILGSGFIANANVFISNTGGTLTNVTTNTTFVSSGEIRANVPSTTAGNYTLYVFNPSGSAAIYYSGIAFEPYPLWNTTSVTFGGTTISGNVATYVTSTAGIQPITFSLAAGNTLPSGLTLYSNGAILGTITQSNSTQTYYANIVATDLYNEATTSNISLTVNLTDPSFNSTTLLLNGETNTGTNYIADASTNNFALTVSGAANPNRFSPLWGAGYYGNSFDGSTGYINLTGSGIALGTNSFTIEFWAYINAAVSSAAVFVDMRASSSAVAPLIQMYTSNILYYSVGSSNVITGPALAFNQWYHIAVSRASGSTRMFLDGVQVGSTYTDSNTYVAQTNRPILGSYGDTVANRFNGYMSNVRLVNGTGLYTANFTPPTTPLTAIANTALLTCQSANFVDNSTNTFTLTPNGTVTVVPNQPFGALPSSVQNYGSSLFDGSTGYLSSNVTPLGNGDWTVEFWMYPLSTSNQYIFTLGATPDWGDALGCSMIYYRNPTTPYFSYSVGSQSSITVASPIINQWVHIALVQKSTITKLYINGVAQATTFTNTTNLTGTKVQIGHGGASSWNPFYGSISNFRVVSGTAVYTANFTPPTTPLTAIANTALLTLQNKNGANNNTFYDDSVNNFPITRTGTPTQGTFSPFSQTGWSNYFAPANPTYSNCLYINQSSGTDLGSGAFTWECWLNPSVNNQPIATKRASDGALTGSWMIGTDSSNNLYISAVTGSGPTYTTSGTSVTLNVWNHLAIVRNSSNVLSIYINGTRAYTGTVTYNWTCSQILFLGTNGNTGGTFPSGGGLTGGIIGYVSNFRIVQNTAVYDPTLSSLTVPTSPLTAISGTSLLICQSNRFVDNSTNNLTLNTYYFPQVQAFSPFAPGVAYSPTTNGGSLYLNGSTDYLNTASVSPLQFGTNSFTIELWIYPLAGSLTANLFDFRTSAVNGLYPTLLLNAGALNYYTNSATQITGGAPAPYAWSHVALVRNSTSTILYLNGVQTGSTYTDSNNYLDGTSAPVIGGSGFSRGTSYFNGYISNLRIVNGTAVYTSAFTPPTAPLTPIKNASLLLLGTNTGIQDATGKNDITTVGSAKTQANTVKYGTGAMYFDGAGSSMYVPSNVKFGFGTGNFTIEFWLYLNATTTQTIFSELSTGSTQVVPHIYYSNASGIRYFVNGADVITGGALSTGTWYHIAVCRSSGSTKMFINGTQTGSTYTDSNNYLSSTPIILGDYDIPPTGTSTLNGYLDDLRITNGVARYTANFTPPASAFLTL